MKNKVFGTIITTLSFMLIILIIGRAIEIANKDMSTSVIMCDTFVQSQMLNYYYAIIFNVSMVIVYIGLSINIFTLAFGVHLLTKE